ncbi:MAG TPA: hypothetical protein VLH79_14240 [Chthonomonadales bacterium]|nr:hypothetical protein [Chthonomonadales bacterium]
MYWRLAGTFLLAFAVYMLGYVLLSELIVTPPLVHTAAFIGSIGPSGSAESARPVIQDPVPGFMLASAICDMISAMLAFIVWGCSWSLSRLNRRAWMIGMIAFAALLQLHTIEMLAFGQPGQVEIILAIPLLFAAGAVPGFVLGRAFAYSWRAP